MRRPSLAFAVLILLPLASHAGKIATGGTALDQSGTVVASGQETGATTVAQDKNKPEGDGNGGTVTTTRGNGTTSTQTSPLDETQQPTAIAAGPAPTDATGRAVSQQPSRQQASADPQLAQAKDQAWQLMQSGDKDGAQALIKEALRDHPEDPDLRAMAELGEKHSIAMDSGALAKRMAALGSASQTGALGGAAAQDAQQKPILASALGLLGAARTAQLAQPPAALRGALSQSTFRKMEMKDYSGVEEDLTQTLLRDPANWLVYRMRAFTRRFEKKYKDADDDADHALALNPKDGPSHNIKALIRLDQGRHEQALTEANAALALEPKDPDSLATRGKVLLALGRRAEGLADLKAAADANAQFGSLYRKALYDNAGGAGTEGLSRTHALYAAAAGLALLFFGLSLVTRKSSAPATTARRPAMRAEDNVPSGLSGFRILRRIGQGGMGVVYEAYDESLQRKVALKRMREEIAGDPRERKRFMREARLVAGLRHPGIVEIFSLLEQEQALYLVFEYLPGETLDALMERRGGRLKSGEALRLTREVAEALDYAHAQGVVHQDLKPSNVLCSAAGAKVMDFGIARRVQDTLSTMSRAEAVGTPAYMAPEQEQGVVTPKADLFALGVMVYELLAGRAPFGRGGGAFSKLEAAYSPLSEAAGLPKAVDAVLAAALSPDPEKRPSSACAFVEALETALGSLTPVR